jgi:hypothetical protein
LQLSFHALVPGGEPPPAIHQAMGNLMPQYSPASAIKASTGCEKQRLDFLRAGLSPALDPTLNPVQVFSVNSHSGSVFNEIGKFRPQTLFSL